MPEWNSEPLCAIKPILIHYIQCLNTRNFDGLNEILDNNVDMIKSTRATGKTEVIAWLERFFSTKPFSEMSIELKDATAGEYTDSTIQALLWFDIYSEKRKIQTHCESLCFIYESGWKINKIFGITYEPSEHAEHFKKFLPYSE